MANALQNPRSPVSRTLRLFRALFVVMAAGLLSVGLLGFVAVEQTAQPAFCGSCHNMVPYIDTWKNSAHADVACIECHYEPGSLETMEGKFKAITQVAKYVTSTESKPYAEVSDQSCLRSGCHSVPSLEGPIQFGRIAFEHRDHVLEVRRGRQLQCTSCHSHVLEGEHFNVSEAVCFACHFKPEDDGRLPEHSDCQICHGPPKDEILVAGKPFVHSEFTGRGVRCQQCHTSVVKGKGEVREERCHTCHEEEGHLERISDVPFMHEQHVTSHKVECFQCHDEIRHGLLPHDPFESGANDCRSCHDQAHDPGMLVLAGTGAVGVEDRPSRMSETMVDCLSCHTGFGATGEGAHDKPDHAAASAATEADCFHCHGTAFAGMLGRWQSTVTGQVERLTPLLEASATDDPALAPELAAARKNLALIRRDPSRGAHNPAYSMAVARDVAARIDRVQEALGLPTAGQAAAGLPVASADGCADSCHMGIEETATVRLEDRLFPHRKHLLDAGLDCSQCHSSTEHGMPAFPRQDCASCHHEPAEERPEQDCADCHTVQAGMFAGEIEGFEGYPSMMPDLSCSDCHGEADDLMVPDGDTCVMCHDEDYLEYFEDWRTTTAEALAELEEALRSAGGADPAALERARRALQLIRTDGSGGAHNNGLAESILAEGLDALGG